MFDTSSVDDLDTASKRFVPKNTNISLKWAFRIFSHWVEHSKEVGRDYKTEDLWLCRDAKQFTTMLSQYCLEVKQRNGTPYTPKSILQILINLQSYARSQDTDSFSFMNQKDTRFLRIHNVLDNMSCSLHKEGVGVFKVQARIITETEEQRLWESGVMGTSCPTSLLNAVFFYCGLHLCLRGGDEHLSLKFSQFLIKKVENPSKPNETIECLVYSEHGSKNRPGSTHQVHLANKQVVHYANSSLGERCFVYLVQLYMSKLPLKAIEKDQFYCKPATCIADGKPWYYGVSVGHNQLRRKLKDMKL